MFIVQNELSTMAHDFLRQEFESSLRQRQALMEHAERLQQDVDALEEGVIRRPQGTPPASSSTSASFPQNSPINRSLPVSSTVSATLGGFFSRSADGPTKQGRRDSTSRKRSSEERVKRKETEPSGSNSSAAGSARLSLGSEMKLDNSQRVSYFKSEVNSPVRFNGYDGGVSRGMVGGGGGIPRGAVGVQDAPHPPPMVITLSGSDRHPTRLGQSAAESNISGAVGGSRGDGGVGGLRVDEGFFSFGPQGSLRIAQSAMNGELSAIHTPGGTGPLKDPNPPRVTDHREGGGVKGDEAESRRRRPLSSSSTDSADTVHLVETMRGGGGSVFYGSLQTAEVIQRGGMMSKGAAASKRFTSDRTLSPRGELSYKIGVSKSPVPPHLSFQSEPRHRGNGVRAVQGYMSSNAQLVSMGLSTTTALGAGRGGGGTGTNLTWGGCDLELSPPVVGGGRRSDVNKPGRPKKVKMDNQEMIRSGGGEHGGGGGGAGRGLEGIRSSDGSRMVSGGRSVVGGHLMPLPHHRGVPADTASAIVRPQEHGYAKAQTGQRGPVIALSFILSKINIRYCLPRNRYSLGN